MLHGKLLLNIPFVLLLMQMPEILKFQKKMIVAIKNFSRSTGWSLLNYRMKPIFT